MALLDEEGYEDAFVHCGKGPMATYRWRDVRWELGCRWVGVVRVRVRDRARVRVRVAKVAHDIAYQFHVAHMGRCARVGKRALVRAVRGGPHRECTGVVRVDQPG